MTRPSGRLIRHKLTYFRSYSAAMTTSEPPPYDPNATTQQPAPNYGSSPSYGSGPGYGSAPAPTQTVRKGPGWGAYLVTIVALLLIAAVVIFAIQNDQPIHIEFLSWKHNFSHTSVALGAMALGGFVAGLFLGLVPWMSARRQLRTLKRTHNL